MNELRIYMRQKQLLNIYGQPVIAVGTNPGDIHYQNGTLQDQTWVEYTANTVGLDKITFTYTTQQDQNGQVEAGEFVPTKGVTGTVSFDTVAYNFIKSILVSSPTCALDQIEVQILDVACGEYYTGYVIKYTQVSWCEINSTCTYDITLTQSDDYFRCVQQTVISDNWQGMFSATPAKGKRHPRFSYCVEARPNGILTVGWFLLGLTSFITISVLTVILAVFSILDIVILAVNAILSIFGIGSIGTLPGLWDLTSVVDSYLQQYVESAGCGREHPAPLIRDYITNVCDKCGVQYSPETAPIFFAPTLTLTLSDGQQHTFDNPYYNACYYSPILRRGIRRFRGIDIFGGLQPNNTDWYIPDNAPLFALDQFLDLIKGVFNAQWRIEDGFLYIERKDWYNGSQPLYNFTSGSPDRQKLVDGICYTWQGVKSSASCKGIYADDPADKLAHEAASQQNSIVSFQQTVANPNFEGILDKTVQIGAAKFNLDGASTCYYYDAAQVIVNIPAFNLITIPQMQTVMGWMGTYADYAILQEGETTSLPKILIWDGKSYANAKCVRDLEAYPGLSKPMPTPNPYYPLQVAILDSNNDPVLDANGYPLYNTYPAPWNDVNAHPPQTFVIGGNDNLSANPPGIYLVSYLGIQIAKGEAQLVNFPMYFEQHYLGTLWDIFHWIDDPIRNPKLHLNFDLKIKKCCEDLDKLAVFGDSNEVKLLQHVLLDNGILNDGQITDIDICYDSGSNLGPGSYIQIKGFV